MKSSISRRNAFSLVEVLAATVLLGILAFIAVPNIIKMRDDGEVKLAIVRAEAVNMSIASYIQSQGRSAAVSAWTTAASGDTDGANRYALIKPYLSYAPNAFGDYMPGSYTITLPSDITTLSKVALADPGGDAISY